jgi:hypothetical protein
VPVRRRGGAGSEPSTKGKGVVHAAVGGEHRGEDAVMREEGDGALGGEGNARGGGGGGRREGAAEGEQEKRKLGKTKEGVHRESHREVDGCSVSCRDLPSAARRGAFLFGEGGGRVTRRRRKRGAWRGERREGKESRPSVCLRNPARRRRRGEQSTDRHPALVKGIETTVLVPSRPNTPVFLSGGPNASLASGVDATRENKGDEHRIVRSVRTRSV